MERHGHLRITEDIRGKLTPEQEEIRQLRSKVRQLEMDKNILKEATVFFAKEMK
jgi:transposase